MWIYRLLVLLGIVGVNVALWALIIWVGVTIVKYVWGG